ncbi:MAG: response regulator, partial [Planctomycetota bacterium]
LVVDDESAVRNLTCELLHDMGHHPTACAGGAAAVRHIRTHGSATDLVILDVMMPGMDGPATQAALQELDPDIRIVVASGYTTSEAVDRMLEQGARCFLRKPFRQSQLAEAIAVGMEPNPDGRLEQQSRSG